MAYFNHAYQQTWVTNEIEEVKGQLGETLAAGELAVLDGATYQSVQKPAGGAALGTSAAANAAAGKTTGYLLSQGNWNRGAAFPTKADPGNDIIGGNTLHGGYAETYKSKIIQPRFISSVHKMGGSCGAADTAVVDIQIPNSCIKCDGSTSDGNQVRIDLKGQAVLRFLNRFSYSVYDLTECCKASPTVAGYVDGADVAEALVAAINDDPLINPFVTASQETGSAPGAAGNNKVRLTVGYTATFFDNCSFDTRDNVDTEPITMTVSVMDDDGNACTDTCITGVASSGGTQATMPSTGLTVELLKKEKSGENVLRDLILTHRYRQDGGHNQGNRDSARFRDIEHGDNIIAAVDRTKWYQGYGILHTVPRYNNPTGVFDNDQYLYNIYIECTDSTHQTAWELFMNAFAFEANAYNPNVPPTMQTIG
tara:strand:- start:1748 stop:3019 length:1272 start_codon:yes stop_codon:yes gene_type:complete